MHPALPSRDDEVDAVPAAGSVLSRRAFTGGIAAVGGMSLLAGVLRGPGVTAAAGAPADRPVDDLGLVATAPRLPRGFASTFESRLVRANGIRHHVVIGGDGPPLLLVHGWPENWYAWRFVMPALARDHTV